MLGAGGCSEGKEGNAVMFEEAGFLDRKGAQG